MPRQLVIDSSTLLAFEKAGLVGLLKKLDYALIVPVSVNEEIDKGGCRELLALVKVVHLKGRSIKKASKLQRLGIGVGEADCCTLANKLKIHFVVCNDRKFIRQKFFSSDKTLKNTKVFGFAFLLHKLFKNKSIGDVWHYFDKIISLNNWARSEVQASNYAFLRELGY